jgi:hypothetical protein
VVQNCSAGEAVVSGQVGRPFEVVLKKGRGMSRIERAWMLWIMAESVADDARHWVRSSVVRRERAQGLVEYAFSIISVVAIAVAFYALLQVAMTAMGQRAVTAVNDVK